MSTEEAIKAFYEWRSLPKRGLYEGALSKLCLYVHNRDIRKVREKDIIEIMKCLQAMGYKPNTLLGFCVAMRAFFRYLHKRKYSGLDPDLIPLPRQEVNIRHIKADNVYDKILASIKRDTLMGRRDYALISLTMDSGARISEVLSLKWEDIDYERQKAVIKTKKSRGMRPIRELCWTQRTNEALKSWAAAFPRWLTDDVFISVSGAGIGKAMNVRTAEDIFKRRSREAGLSQIMPHELRHRLGHILAKKGVGPNMISNILGHSSIQSSLRYTMMNHEEMRETYHSIMGK